MRSSIARRPLSASRFSVRLTRSTVSVFAGYQRWRCTNAAAARLELGARLLGHRDPPRDDAAAEEAVPAVEEHQHRQVLHRQAVVCQLGGSASVARRNQKKP